MKQIMSEESWMQQCKHATTGDVPTRKFEFESGWILEACEQCAIEMQVFWQSKPKAQPLSVSQRRSIAMRAAWIRRRKNLKEISEQKLLREQIAARSKVLSTVHLKRSPSAPHKGGSWTATEDEVIRRFYSDMSNFSVGGRMKHAALKTIAKMLGRTKGAIQMRSVAIGFSLKKRQAALKFVAQPPKESFPVFREVKADAAVIKDALLQLVKKKGSKLVFAEAAFLGIHTQKEWAELKSAVIMHSNELAKFFNVENKFHLENNAICYG